MEGRLNSTFVDDQDQDQDQVSMLQNFFPFITDAVGKYSGAFAPGKHFQPIPIFAGKARSYQKGSPFKQACIY